MKTLNALLFAIILGSFSHQAWAQHDLHPMGAAGTGRTIPARAPDGSGTTDPGSVAGDTGARRKLDGGYARADKLYSSFRHCRGTNGLNRGWR
jgi:hypothetical protein